LVVFLEVVLVVLFVVYFYNAANLCFFSTTIDFSGLLLASALELLCTFNV